jgi:hypothetical protein
MDSIKRVLELLESGKISSEEAERLIRAINERSEVYSEGKYYTGLTDFISDLGQFIGSVVSTAVKTSLRYSAQRYKRKKEEFPYTDNFFMEVSGGAVEIYGEKREGIEIEYEGDFKYEENRYYLKGGKAEVYLPENISIEISLNGSFGEIEGRFKSLLLDLNGSKLEGDIEFKELQANVKGGKFELETSEGALLLEVHQNLGKVKLPEGYKNIDNKFIYGENPDRFAKISVNTGVFKLYFK